MNGQKCVVLAVFPSASSRVLQVELLGDEHPRPIVFIPRINFPGTVGRNGITCSRVQFSIRLAYCMTTNLKDKTSLK